jgi:hypothetical protein
VCKPYESGRHSVMELTLAFPHSSYSARDGLTGRFGGTTPGFDSQMMSEGRHGGGFALNSGARSMSEHLMLRSGEWLRGSRTRGIPERGRDPLEGEGARYPRVRRRSARGGAWPSSEAEVCSRDAKDGNLMGH